MDTIALKNQASHKMVQAGLSELFNARTGKMDRRSKPSQLHLQQERTAETDADHSEHDPTDRPGGRTRDVVVLEQDCEVRVARE